MRVLGIIPARAGSKGLPNKNLRTVGGKTLVRRAAESALASILNVSVLSTDCAEIGGEVLDIGVPLIGRPDELATDDADMLSVVKHAVEAVGDNFDAVMVLQPTCPLRTTSDINEAIDILEQNNVTSVVSIAPCRGYYPERMMRRGKNGLELLGSHDASHTRQALPEYFVRSGDIYLSTIEQIKYGNGLVGARWLPLYIPAERHCNIDDEIDLCIAQALWERLEEVHA